MFNSCVISSALLCSLLFLFSSRGIEAGPESPGGEGSTTIITSDAFALPMRNITAQHRKDFVIGRSTFRQNWVAAPSSVKTVQGLGPTFNAQSCVSCHVNDGRGRPPLEPKEEFVGLLLRLSIPGADAHGGPNPTSAYGDQLEPHAILGVLAEGTPSVTYTEVEGKFSDGEKYFLAKPTYSIGDLNYGPLPKDAMISPRVAAGIFGSGLLEAISEKDILKNVHALDADGVAGKPNYVWDFSKKKKVLGRFGWKANQPSVDQQNAAALNGDIGITSPMFPHQNCPSVQKSCLSAYDIGTPEISAKDFRSLSNYVKTLAVPKRRPLDADTEAKGSALMTSLGCVNCHHPHFKTGIDPKFPENSRQDIYPYTDLLLHDMGEGLADARPDFQANGREWRTPPLWGIGLVKTVNGHTRFLHDGRARNLEEAILWHDGEAHAAKEKFRNLSKADRKLFIQFLESL